MMRKYATPGQRRAALNQYLAMSGIAVALISGIMTVILMIDRPSRLHFEYGEVQCSPGILSIMDEACDPSGRAIINAQNHIKALEAKVDQLERRPVKTSNAGSDGAALDNISHQFADLVVRQRALEVALENTPEKALSLPLLRKDLDHIKESQDQRFLALSVQIDRMYDMNKWLLGGACLSAILFALSHFFSLRAASRKPHEAAPPVPSP